MLSRRCLTGEQCDDLRCDAVRDNLHVGFAAAGDWVGEFDSGNVGHAGRGGDEIALGPERRRYESDGGNVSASYFDAVTHGARSAAASMAVGGNHRLAFGLDLVEHGLAGHR
jgi:hypothetical protein